MTDSRDAVRTSVSLVVPLVGEPREDPRIWACTCGHNYQWHTELGYQRGRCEHGQSRKRPCRCERFQSVVPNSGLR